MRHTTLTDGPLALIAPLLLWVGHLLFVYVVFAIGCAVRPNDGAATLPALWVATFAVASALALLGGAQYRRGRVTRAQAPAEGVRHLVLHAAPFISLIALVAVLWAALPLLFVVPCA